MKLTKRITSALLIIALLAFCLIIPISSINQKENLVAINREYTGEYEIFLPPDVPLGASLEASGFRTVLEDINTYRSSYGLHSLEWNSALSDAAAVRAQECTVTWSHTRPDGSEWYTVNPEIMYGENLSKGYNNSEIVSAWKASPSHNENLLFDGFKYIGLAEYNGYVACEFCY